MDLFKLSDCEIKAQNKDGINYNKVCDVRINDEIFSLFVKYDNYKETYKDHQYETEDFYFKITKKGSTVFTFRISIGNGINKTKEASLHIEKNKNTLNEQTLKGVGAELYKKMLDFLQSYSDNSNQSFQHFVIELGDMPTKDWHKIFDPVLANRSYTKLDGTNYEHWVKTYTPKTQSV